ncbi:MAG: hypothetical protein HY846_11555 [Nitrosomonadales bacterium]|nr:hypothetical protein [Nitrosomonadales bacterium]
MLYIFSLINNGLRKQAEVVCNVQAGWEVFAGAAVMANNKAYLLIQQANI